MDKVGADFFQCVSDIKTRVGGRPVCVQLPIGSEHDFKGIIDLIRMKAVVWDEEGLGAKYHDEEIPANLLDQAKEYRLAMIEAAVEMDDDAMSAYLDGQEPDEATLKRLIRAAVRTITFVPVLCGTAFKNKGVQPLLDAVVDFLPSPADREGIKGIDMNTGEEIIRRPLDSEPFSMLGFKIMDDPFVGTITFCRVYSGKIESGTTVLNSTKDKKERVGRMLLMHANNREDIKEAYGERLTKRAEIDYVHKKQTGGSGQFAKIKVVYEPNEPGKGNEFESKIIGGNVPKEYIPGVEKGIASVMGSGVLAGFPVVDLKATLIDGAYHDVDSWVLASELAARAATREALQKGGSVLLEPIMKVEVVTPEEYTGSVIGDLNSRRGHIQGQDVRGNANVINAMVPLANMFGYVNQLRSFSQGRAVFTMQFDHYEQVPANEAAKVQAKYA